MASQTALRKELAEARLKTAEMQRGGGRAPSISPTEFVDMRATLAAELSSGSRGSQRKSMDYDSLRQQESAMRRKLEDAQSQRLKPPGLVEQSLDIGLVRPHPATAPPTARQPHQSATEDAVELQARCAQLEADNAVLRKVAESAAARLESAQAMLAEAQDRAANANAAKELAEGKVLQLQAALTQADQAEVGNLKLREEEVRDEIRGLQEQRFAAIKTQCEELDQENQELQRLSAELATKLREAESTIEQLGARQGLAVARQEEAERERELGIGEIDALRAQIERMRVDSQEFQRAFADAETPSRGGSQSGVAVDDALDQRDAALERCHELEAALARERSRPRAPAQSSSAEALRAAIERNARTEALAGDRIRALETRLAEVEAELAARPLGDGAEETIALLQAKQREIDSLRGATSTLKRFAQRVRRSSARGGRQSEGENVRSEADQALAGASAAERGGLPSGWEAMTQPDTGLVYYVDHNQRTTSWIHPGFAPGRLSSYPGRLDDAGYESPASQVPQAGSPMVAGFAQPAASAGVAGGQRAGQYAMAPAHVGTAQKIATLRTRCA